MDPVWKVILWAVVVSLLLALAAYVVLRWLSFRITHRLAVMAEARLAATLAPGMARPKARFNAPAVALSDAELQRYLAQLDRLAWLMDGVIPLPVIGGVGLDALLGLIPVAGDVASLAISSLLVVRAAQLGAPPELLSRLVAIQCIDLVLGFVPVVGDLADAGYHSNERSVALLREWVASVRR